MQHRYNNSVATIAVLIACLTAAAANAQSPRTEHTFKLDAPENRPAASLHDVSWLVGSWSGDAFGDRFEEVWNPASAGSMVGMFKLLKGGEVAFYELLLLAEDEGSLSLKVKHFNNDFTAWEEKKDYVNFRLVKIEKDAVHFVGLSFYRVGDDEIHGYLAMNHDGEIREEKLTYRRRGASAGQER